MVDHIHGAGKHHHGSEPVKNKKEIDRNVLETAELTTQKNDTWIGRSMKHALSIVTNNLLSAARSFGGRKRHITQTSAPRISTIAEKTLNNREFGNELHKIRISGTPKHK